jgi:hypothetical protein
MAAIEENWIKMGKMLSWNMFELVLGGGPTKSSSSARSAKRARSLALLEVSMGIKR